MLLHFPDDPLSNTLRAMAESTVKFYLMGYRYLGQDSGPYELYTEYAVGMEEVMATLGFAKIEPSTSMVDLNSVVSIWQKKHAKGDVTVQLIDSADLTKKHTAWKLRAKLEHLVEGGEKEVMSAIYQGLT